MEPNPTNQTEFSQLLDAAIDQKASDLHIQADSSPMLRVDGKLRPLDIPPYNAGKAHDVVTSFIGQGLLEKISGNRQELDFSFSYRDTRFRVNVFYATGNISASLRLLATQNSDLATLGVPQVVSDLAKHNQGLIIVAGPTGHGKSTTLAALVNHITQIRRGHIITIEDPIEYIFQSSTNLISQREVGIDTPSFSTALRAALREDPDVVLVGEMRDLETVEAALQMAETGHLVLTSLHTNSAAQTADRIVSIFPASQQNQVRQQLSEMLLGIVSQRLLPKVQGGRILASEVLVANPAVRSILREGKTHQISNLIQTSASEGMVTLEKSLADMVSRGDVTIDDALAWTNDPKGLKMLVY